MADGDFEVVGKIIVDSSGAVSIQGISDDIDKISQRSGELGTNTDSLGVMWDYVWGGVILGALTAAYNGIVQVAGAASSFAMGAVSDAARLDELTIVLHQMGSIAGITSGEVDAAVESVAKMGIQSDVATETVIEFIKANMDLADASNIARVAQDAAVISGMNSSDTTDRIIYGITSLNVLILRNAGIMVDSQIAYDKYAETLGKSAAEMTTAEKQQAMLNAVLEYGTKIAGTYEQAMGNAYKQLGSFERYIYDVKIAIGEALLPAYTAATFAVKDFLVELGKLVMEGGALNPILQSMGDIALQVALGFKSALASLVDFGVALAQDYQVGGWAAVLQDLDVGIAVIFDNMTKAVNDWLSSDGPQKLADSIISWIDKIGTGDTVTSKTLIAIGHLLDALISAVVAIDWGALSIALQEATARVITNVDWNALGKQMGEALSGALTGSFSSGAIKLPDEWLLLLLLPGVWSLRNSPIGQAIQEAISGLFTGLAEGVAVNINPVIDTVSTWFQKNISIIKQWWTDIQIWFNTSVDNIKTAIAGWWDGVTTSFNAKAGEFNAVIQGIIDGIFSALGIDKAEFLAKWNEIFTGIGETAAKIGQVVAEQISIIWAYVSGEVTKIFTTVSEIAIGKMNDFKDIFNEIFSLVATVVTDNIDKAKTTISGLLDAINQVLINIKNAIVNSTAFQAISTGITNAINEAISNVSSVWSEMTQLGRNIIDGIIAGIEQQIGDLLTTITDNVLAIVNKFKTLLGISSPSSIFKDIAKSMIDGLILGWNTYFGSLLSLIQTGIGNILDLFGIDLGTIFGGTTGGGTTGGGTGGGGTTGGSGGQVVNNYYYGTVYFGAAGEPGLYYDCPSPNPIVAGTYPPVTGTGGSVQ